MKGRAYPIKNNVVEAYIVIPYGTPRCDVLRIARYANLDVELLGEITKQTKLVP